MLRLHRLLPFLATSLAIVLLAACGSPSTGGPLPDPDPDPAPVRAPSISAVAPEAAARGQALTVKGTNFGDTAGAAPLTVANLDLYGRGADATRLLLSNPAHLLLLADFGSQATLADLELAGGTLAFGADSAEARVSWATRVRRAGYYCEAPGSGRSL